MQETIICILIVAAFMVTVLLIELPMHRARMKPTPSFAAFVTGSRAYGTPKIFSDTDVVIFISEADLAILKAAPELKSTEEDDKYSKNTKSASLRFGNLNLIALTDERAYRAWLQSTVNLKCCKPVPRETACSVIAEALRKAGVK